MMPLIRDGQDGPVFCTAAVVAISTEPIGSRGQSPEFEIRSRGHGAMIVEVCAANESITGARFGGFFLERLF